MDRLQEIESRKAEIKDLVDTLEDLEEVRKYTEEVEQLNLELRDLQEREERKDIAEQIEEGKVEVREVELKEENKMEERKIGLESEEYRSAFLKSLMGKELNTEERSVITSATENSAGKAIPTQTENEIFSKVAKKAPMLDEVTLLNVRGNVDFVVETSRSDGAAHDEGDSITESGINLTKVSLAGTEIVKLVTISETVKSMTIDAFEGWLTDMLSDSIANAIEGKIVAKIEETGTAKNKAINADNIREQIGELPASYDNGAKFYVSKKIFFTSVLGLQDNAKNDIVTVAGGKYYIYGYEVVFTDKATKLILCNAKKFVANVPQAIQVKSAYNIANNTYSYAGVAMYDGKLAVSDAAIVLGTSASV